MQTERVTFLTSRDHKAALSRRAAANGLSMGEYVRRKTYDDEDITPEQEAELALLVEEANAAIPKMQASIDRIIATLDKSHAETEAFLKKMGVR